jgi:hypothetical protein
MKNSVIRERLTVQTNSRAEISPTSTHSVIVAHSGGVYSRLLLRKKSKKSRNLMSFY